MKATFNKDQFLKMLFTVVPYISGKTTLPICEEVLLKKTKENVSMTVTDLETTIVCTLPTINGDEFELVFDGKKLLEILKISSDASFNFIVDTIEENDKQIPRRITIELLNGNVVFSVHPASEFPQIPEMKEFERNILPAKVISKRKETWGTFCGHDELRPIMSSVNIEVVENEDGRFLYSVATNAHILFVEKIKTDASPMSVNIPQRLMYLLSKIVKDDDLICYVNEERIKVVKDGTMVYGRLQDGKFPNWRAVVPTNEFYFEIDRVQLLNTLNKLHITANETTHQIVIKIGSKDLTMESMDTDYARESKYTIPANIYGPGITIAVNADYFMKCLQQFSSGLIRIEYQTHKRALVVKGTEEKGLLTLCMPHMLDIKDSEEEALIQAWRETNLEPVVTPVENPVPIEAVVAEPVLTPEEPNATPPYAEDEEDELPEPEEPDEL